MTRSCGKFRFSGGALLAGILLGMAPDAAVAAIVSLPASAGAPNGRTVPVSVVADECGGTISADLRIEFDPAVALAVGVSTTPDTAGFILTANTGTPGVIVLSLFGTAPLGGRAELVRIDLQVVGVLGDSTPLELVTAELNEGGIAVIPLDGMFTVLPTYRVAQATVNSGGTNSGALSFRLGASTGQELVVGASSDAAYVLQSGFWSFAGAGVVPVVVSLTPAGLAWSGNDAPYSVYRSADCGDVLSSLLITTPAKVLMDPEVPAPGQTFCYQVLPSPPGS